MSDQVPDEPDSDWLPPADREVRMDDPHEGESEWKPLPIPEGDEDVDL